MAKRKGPTWDQIHAPGSNKIEHRPSGGYFNKRTQMGKTRIDLRCPFCNSVVTAYLWSLPNGKRCDCGAMAGRDGTFHHFTQGA